MSGPLARVLIVDDEPHILSGLRRLLRKDFAVDTAAGPVIGLQRIVEAGPYAVVLSDYQMPEMNGADLLTEARRLNPNTSRILLTGHADLPGAAAAVNSAGILRMLLKPVEPWELVDALRAGVESYRQVNAEHDLLDSTLRGSLRAISEVLALANPTLFARSARLRDLVVSLIREAGVEVSWYDELAASLSQIGAVALPSHLLERAGTGQLHHDEQEAISALPGIADRVLAGIPRMEVVRDVILAQRAHFDGAGAEDSRCGSSIPLGGPALRIARDFDTLLASGLAQCMVLTTLRDRSGVYDPDLLNALDRVLVHRAAREPLDLTVDQLHPGMILASYVATADGIKLVVAGSELSVAMLERIHHFARMATGISEPVQVYAPSVVGVAVESHAA